MMDKKTTFFICIFLNGCITAEERHSLKNEKARTEQVCTKQLSTCPNVKTHRQKTLLCRSARTSSVNKSYKVKGCRYYPQPYYELTETGIASHYGLSHKEKVTTTGELYCHWKLTAAHKTLPLPCLIKVENLENGRTVVVRVNDRGPFAKGRILDLSAQAAKVLGFYRKGIARVKITTLVKESAALYHLGKRSANRMTGR